MKLTFTEYTFWNILADEEQVRLSVFSHGIEYFAMLSAGRGYRRAKPRALEVLAEVIQSAGEPGDHTEAVRLALAQETVDAH